MNPVSLERKNAERRDNEPPMPTADFEAAIRAVGPSAITICIPSITCCTAAS